MNSKKSQIREDSTKIRDCESSLDEDFNKCLEKASSTVHKNKLFKQFRKTFNVIAYEVGFTVSDDILKKFNLDSDEETFK
jgi:hypothetical protein